MTEWLIAYDVSNSGRRARISALLSRYGIKAQYSVFTATLSEKRAKQLIAELKAMVSDADRLIFARRCAACTRESWSAGEPLEMEHTTLIVL